jgi:hypothetical protein
LQLQDGAVLDGGHVREQPALDVDLLQLALNCGNHETAYAAANRINPWVETAQLEPAVACRLLLTAATRQHPHAVRRLAETEGIRHHVDAATLASVLELMTWSSSCVKALCQMPAAAQLSSDQLTMVLQAATQEGSPSSITPIAALPAAGQLSSGDIEQLMHMAVTSDILNAGHSRVGVLCAQPAAQVLSYSAIARLLLADANVGSSQLRASIPSSAQHLCRLPEAAQLSSSMIVPAMQEATENGDNSCPKWLCRLPAARQLSAAELQPMLQAARQHGYTDCAKLLTSLLAESVRSPWLSVIEASSRRQAFVHVEGDPHAARAAVPHHSLLQGIRIPARSRLQAPVRQDDPHAVTPGDRWFEACA